MAMHVGFRDPATRERFELWGACGDLNLPNLTTHDLTRPSASSSKRHKETEIYTGSGHHCGVIPDSSVCGGFPRGAMDEQVQGMNKPAEEKCS